MISDDLTTPLSAIVTLFMARRRFGRTYYDATRSFCWCVVGEQFRSDDEVMNTRVKSVKKREPGENTHAQRRIRNLE